MKKCRSLPTVTPSCGLRRLPVLLSFNERQDSLTLAECLPVSPGCHASCGVRSPRLSCQPLTCLLSGCHTTQSTGLTPVQAPAWSQRQVSQKLKPLARPRFSFCTWQMKWPRLSEVSHHFCPNKVRAAGVAEVMARRFERKAWQALSPLLVRNFV
jgi:hypothetical protein